MALPITYNIRNVLVRWRTTLFTILGVTLVVAVYVLLQSMAAGIEKSSASTGDPRNVLIVRKGSTADGFSVSDFEKEEKEHGHSIFSTILHCDHLGKRINLIDAPVQNLALANIGGFKQFSYPVTHYEYLTRK